LLKTLRDAWKVKDLRKKMLWTLLLLVLFRLGANITAPGVNGPALANQLATVMNSGILSTINVISGNAFGQLAIFAMSIGPYITASIVIQLLTVAIPALEELQKEGEAGKQRLNDYTKYLAGILAAVEAFGVYMTFRNYGVFLGEGFIIPFMFVMTLTAGSTLLMWIADKISQHGIANGSSLLIFAGIVVGLPQAAILLWSSLVVPDGVFSITGLLALIGIIIGAIAIIAAVVYVTEAERRVPVQYAKKVVGRKMYGGQSTHIPLKPAMAGVMPVIFASSFMTFPAMMIQIFASDKVGGTGFLSGLYKFSIATSTSQGIEWGYSLANAIVYFLLIVGFTFFYTFATFDTNEVATNIKQNGGFVPGIRAGKPTADYLRNILIKITWFGAAFLSLIAILPMLMRFSNIDVSFGGTSILIVVGVALETVQQLESQLVMRHYKGFLEK